MRTLHLALTALLLCLSPIASAAIEMPAVFSDHMVLQRDAPVPVWGTASPGAKMSVVFLGQTYTATAGEDGRWRVELPAMPAGGPHKLTVSGDDETLTIDDVMVGEVWVCSGQSNMAWSVGRSNNAEQEIAAADYPQIRLFRVQSTVAGEPKSDTPGQWQACSPQTVGGYSAVAYFFGRQLHEELDVPIGLIQSAWGGTPIESWMSTAVLESLDEASPTLKRYAEVLAAYPQAHADYEQALATWNEADAKTRGRRPRPPQGPEHPHRPAGLYNGMIYPLIPFAIRGVIWYQGESNAGQPDRYRVLFPAMIQDWRRAWGRGDFPFLFVQLANFMKPSDAPTDTGWARLRDAQLHTLRTVPNTGMAVTIDIGEADDIHPRNKQDVGTRLARWALADSYKMRHVVKSGPLFKEMAIDGDQVTLTFDHAGGLATRDGESLQGFTVAGEDRSFVVADAVIEGGRVIVSAPGVAKPVAVRYAWANNPEQANLVNGEGLPASPFRTDDWPWR